MMPWIPARPADRDCRRCAAAGGMVLVGGIHPALRQKSLADRLRRMGHRRVQTGAARRGQARVADRGAGMLGAAGRPSITEISWISTWRRMRAPPSRGAISDDLREPPELVRVAPGISRRDGSAGR